MKNWLGILSFVIVALSVSLPVQAEELKVAYVDLQQILATSDAGKKARDVFKGEVERMQKSLDSKQEALKKMKDELESQNLLLSEETKAKRQKEYQEKLKDFQRFYQDSQEELEQKDQQMTKKILVDIRKVIVDVGEEGGYSMIFEKHESSLLYSNKSYDLTAEVVKRMNEGTPQ